MAKPRPLAEQIGENTQINITPDDERDIERIKTFARRSSTDELIRDITTIDLIVANANAEREVLINELEKRFEGEKTYELLTSQYGVAERKVTNIYNVDPKKVDALRDKLGTEFEDMIEEKVTHKIAPSKVDELVSRLGPDAPDFFTSKTSYKCTKLASTRLREGDGRLAKVLGKAVNVVQKIVVKVRPVNSEVKG